MSRMTTSLWGPPPSRFYRFLKQLHEERSRDEEFDLAVMGCADGKFVLPAARRGLRVLAVDVDAVALFGGPKPGLGGIVEMPGLQKRLEAEGLQEMVEVQCSDFTKIAVRSCRAVFTSGAIQYSLNGDATAESLLTTVMRFVSKHGLFYIDYMLPFEDKYKGRPNCPSAAWWKEWANGLSGWIVEYNRVLPPVRDVAHVEYPVDHYHQWGHLLARRLRPCRG